MLIEHLAPFVERSRAHIMSGERFLNQIVKWPGFEKLVTTWKQGMRGVGVEG